jgi:hypothetical protein
VHFVGLFCTAVYYNARCKNYKIMKITYEFPVDPIFSSLQPRGCKASVLRIKQFPFCTVENRLFSHSNTTTMKRRKIGWYYIKGLKYGSQIICAIKNSKLRRMTTQTPYPCVWEPVQQKTIWNVTKSSVQLISPMTKFKPSCHSMLSKGEISK